MDPLQLEESNDASDAAAALMCKAAENVAAALHPPTPYKTDQTLENDLINECHRLEDVPSVEKVKQRNQRLIELFGEDSTNLSESTSTLPSVPETVMEVALAQSTPLITKQTTRKSRRISTKKPVPIEESGGAGCARMQVYPVNPQANRRKSQRRSNSSKSSKSPEDETIIQELLAMSRLNISRDPVKQSPLLKRKRRSDPPNHEKHGLPGEGDAEKKSKRKESNLSGFNDTITNEASTSMDELVSVSCASSTSSSREEVDVEIAEAPLDSLEKSGRSKKTTKEREKPATRGAPKACSSNSFGMATRRTPVKLFKSALPPYARKAVSYRQSAGVKNTPMKISTGEPSLIVNVPNKDTCLEKDSVGEFDMPDTVSLANDIQPTEDLARAVESGCLATDKFAAALITEIAENADVLPAVMQQPELLVASENSAKETAAVAEVSKEPSVTSPVIPVENLPVESIGEKIETANKTTAADIEESNAVVDGGSNVGGSNVVVSPKNNPIAVCSKEEAPASPSNRPMPGNSSENAEELNRLSSKPISDVLCEIRHPTELLSSTSLETEPANTAKIVLSHDNVEVVTKECSLPSEPIMNCVPEETLHLAEALSNVNVRVTLANSSRCLVSQDDRVMKSNQKLSSSNVPVAKEKTNRSNSKLKNYLRLSSFNGTSDVWSSKKKPSASDATVLSAKSSSPAHPKPTAIPIRGPSPLQETTLFMHKDLVNKMRKQIRLSKEVDLYSQ